MLNDPPPLFHVSLISFKDDGKEIVSIVECILTSLNEGYLRIETLSPITILFTLAPRAPEKFVVVLIKREEYG